MLERAKTCEVSITPSPVHSLLAQHVIAQAYIPATHAKRTRVGKGAYTACDSEMCCVDRPSVLGSIVDASAGAVVQCWLSQCLLDLAVNVIHLPGRTSWECWQESRHRPRYTLGTWVGRNDCEDDWTVVSTKRISLEVISVTVKTFPMGPHVVPWQGSPPDAAQEEPSLDQKMRLAKPFNVLDSDRDETCVDVELGADRTKWKR